MQPDDDRVQLVIVIEEGIPFADHRPSGLTFSLVTTGELWVSDGRLFGPLDALACVLLEQILPGLVGAARDTLTTWWSQQRRSQAKRSIDDDQLKGLFASAVADARRELAS